MRPTGKAWQNGGTDAMAATDKGKGKEKGQEKGAGIPQTSRKPTWWTARTSGKQCLAPSMRPVTA
eukprot:9285044-Heterocapsa_arctica.AAC.1